MERTPPPADPDFRHATPPDLAVLLEEDEELRLRWKDLTDLARNDYICWILSAKKEETRGKRLKRLQSEVTGGKRRPCCFPGCPHRLAPARAFIEP